MVTESGPSRQDDRTIPNSEDLFRRIRTDCQIVTEQCSGNKRLSSQAFFDSHSQISVDLSSLISPAESLALGDERHMGVAAVTAGEARELKQIVVRAPIEGVNPAHALICGEQTKSVRKGLASKARWIYPPDGNPLM